MTGLRGQGDAAVRVRVELPTSGVLEAVMVAAERTQIRRNRLAALCGVRMVERNCVVEVAVPGRDIAVRPLAAARADPQPGVECRARAVHRCRRRHRCRFGICGYAHFFYRSVFCDVTGMLGADHSVPVEVSGFVAAGSIAAGEGGFVHHDMHEWPANDDHAAARACQDFCVRDSCSSM